MCHLLALCVFIFEKIRGFEPSQSKDEVFENVVIAWILYGDNEFFNVPLTKYVLKKEWNIRWK